ncbi:MAG: DNA ligase D [Chloroflexi bacterium]|nr:MAG: DNA ligase D [Chloroflexota bacterium]
MSLERYRRKRDFGATPEPAGEQRTTGERRFVVQRHRATRLHYDVRLEIDGVLVSWAVPKGPTLDPGQRRMAVHVEDHPVEYFDFEGVIPRGQYGAGDVIVWDWGMFEPEETDDPGRAVRAGELKLRLRGEKLRGRFTLVRTSARGPGSGDDKDMWLLIHKRDEFAVPGWDAEDHPASVKTGRTNDEVARGAPAIQRGGTRLESAEIDLSEAVEGPLADFIPPMKATLTTDAFSDDDWLFEVKWDGYRVEAVVHDGVARLWTRNHNDAALYFPDLAGKASWLAGRDAVVDGEVVALDRDGNPHFSLLQERTGIRGLGLADKHAPRGTQLSPDEVQAIPLVYEVFDLLYLDGRSLLSVPLEHRKRLLQSVIRDHPMVRYASHVVGDGLAFLDAARQRGLEGVVAKHRSSRYEPGRRSRQWLKLKLRREQELVVAGWLPGRGSHKDLGSLIVAVQHGGRLRHAGQVGSGIDARMRRRLLDTFATIRRDTSPLDPAPRLREALWVEPRVVIRAEFAEWTSDGLLRQAAFKGLELDRDPATVHRELAVPTARATATAERETARAGRRAESRVVGRRSVAPPPDATTAVELKALAELPAEGVWTVGGHQVRLTNLDKVLFPPDAEAGQPPVTKRHLIGYYVSMAPVLLGHLAGRAVNLHRYPDGIGVGHGFWQKDVPGHAPPWIGRWTYTGHEGTKDYVVVDSAATLAWLAQEAAIEIHPWTSRTEAPDRPTYALIDIDPGQRSSWEDVLLLARLYRTALAHLGVRGLPKTTGQRGIQVWIPIEPIYTFAQTRDWVERISRAVGASAPDLVSWEWSKQGRGGRARLDYTQNAVNKTLVGPYVVRPAPGAPVSMPIRWEELEDPLLRPNRWNIASAGARLAEVGDLFAEALSLRQELPPL